LDEVQNPKSIFHKINSNYFF